MTTLSSKKLPNERTSHAGLALVGQYLKRIDISHRIDRKFPMGFSNIEKFCTTFSCLYRSYPKDKQNLSTAFQVTFKVVRISI